MNIHDKALQLQLLALVSSGRKMEKAAMHLGQKSAADAYKYMTDRVESIARLQDSS
jgi:hypothetical protein